MRRALSVVGGILIAGLAVFVPFSGCGGEGSYRLRVVFPDEQARGQAAQVTIWALEPGGHECNELMNGEVRPDDLKELSREDVQAPFEQGSKLRQVPEGEVLFVAEGETGGGARILRGCTLAQVRAGATVVVTIELAVVCTPEPEVIGNGTDDDCDGLTDECEQDMDCDDQNGCTADTCVAVECHHANFPDSLQCSDGNRCTVDDACVNGVCTGQSKDCSAYAATCQEGVCNAETGECEAKPAQDGISCDDGLYCTVEDSCQGGQCAGSGRDCSDQDDCTRDSCSEAEDRCEHELDPRPGGEGPQGDATCTDGVDNDCDGKIDGDDPNCGACTGDAECDDGNPCTTDTCAGGSCENAPVADGTSCDDGHFCTVGDECQQGVCVSAARECTASGDCVRGGCLEGEGRCAEEPVADGTGCDDGQYCTVGDQCQGGACTGASRDCDDGDICTADSCREDSDNCEHVLQPIPGAEGPPGDATCGNGVDDDCDGQTDMSDGNCAGDPCDPDPCNGHGTCSGGACSCDTGYAGAACDQCSTFGEYPDCFLPGAGYCNTSQCFIVPPTNQNQCYDNSAQMTCTAFPCNLDGTPECCGQDAQYQDNDKVFTCYDAGGTVQDPCDATADPDEVVTDSLTGLMWQRTWASDLTWQQAMDYCDNLVYAGYDDWLLPNPFELKSIVDYGTPGPAIDTAVFPGTPASFFWSSSSDAFNTDDAWRVYFVLGSVYRDDKNYTYDARCVRPGPSFTGSGGGERYYSQEPVAGEQVVYDAVTGLLWQKSYASGLTWQQALSYCEGLDYAGHDDWKVPDINELMSLVNYSKYSPASDFPDMPSNWFWSSSSRASGPDYAWGVGFDGGHVNGSGKGSTNDARCVRPGP